MTFEEYERIVLDEGITIGEAKGIAIGEAKGKAEMEAKHVKNMAKLGYCIPDIASLLGMSEDEVRGILAKTA